MKKAIWLVLAMIGCETSHPVTVVVMEDDSLQEGRALCKHCMSTLWRDACLLECVNVPMHGFMGMRDVKPWDLVPECYGK